MAEHPDTYLADENRYLYYFYSPKGMTATAEMTAYRQRESLIGWKHYTKEFNDARIVGYPADARADAAVAVTYHGRTVEGVGVREGAYVMASADGKTPPRTPLLATDYLCDCIGLVLTAQDPKNANHKISILAHIDVATDVKREMGKLLQRLPAGYPVTATMLGGPAMENYYTQTDILRVLKASKQVQQIRVNTQDATAVLVDVASGHVFMNARPPLNNLEPQKEHYHITPHMFPINADITFYDHKRDGGPDLDDIECQILMKRTSLKQPFVRHAPLVQLTVKDRHAVGQEATLSAALKTTDDATPGKLNALSKRLARDVGMQVALKYDPATQAVNVIANGTPVDWVQVQVPQTPVVVQEVVVTARRASSPSKGG